MEKLAMTDTEMGELAKMLRSVNFFAPLTVGQLEMVVPYILLLGAKQGEVVFKQGAPGDAFYIISTGKVAINIKKGMLSFSKQVATLGTGEFFGEMALLSNEPRSATVECLEPCRLFTLLATDFQYIIKENTELAATMDRIAAQRKLLSSNR